MSVKKGVLFLTRDVDLVFSTVVLEAARRLPGGGLRPAQEEGHVPVKRILSGFANSLV